MNKKMVEPVGKLLNQVLWQKLYFYRFMLFDNSIAGHTKWLRDINLLNKVKLADKPGSVLDSHSSRRFVA